MTFHVGDPIMHWTYGLGNILALEERIFFEVKQEYYAVKLKDLTVWVPVDENVDNHLRPPTAPADFKGLLAILAEPGESLPEDRQERKLQILDRLKDGRAESLCRVISSLSSYQKIRALNQTDQNLMKRARDSLLGEWTYVLAISLSDAEKALHHLLESGLSKTQGKV